MIKQAPFAFVSAFALCAFGALLLTRSAPKSRAQESPPAEKRPMNPFGNLAKAVESSPGCLGVEQVQAASGKRAIFAWFENKKAAVTFYNSMTHQSLMKLMPQKPTRAPLAGVKDPNAPILCIASVTPAAKPDPQTKLPISQIAIELYTPVEGGFAFGGRFAPSAVKVKGLAEAAAEKPEEKKE